MEINAVLGKVLEEKGLKVESDGAWIQPVGFPFSLRGRWQELDQEGFWRLDIHLPVADGRFLAETFVSPGESSEDAKARTMKMFQSVTLPGLLAGFFNQTPEDENYTLNWADEEQTLKLYRGALSMVAEEGDKDFLPGNFMETLQREVLFQDCKHEIHWIRIMVAQNGYDAMNVEALWDNETWFEAEEALARLEWKPSEGFRSVRLFMVVRPENFTPKPIEEEREALARRLVDAMIHLPAADHADLTALTDCLLRMGFSAVDVREAIAMLQLACGRKLLKEMELEFSMGYWTLEADGQLVSQGELTENPFFQAADQLEPEDLGSVVFSLHANASPEVTAVHAMMEEEEGSSTFAMPPFAYFLAPPSDSGLQAAKTLAAEYLVQRAAESEAQAAAAPVKQKKPWWKVWG